MEKVIEVRDVKKKFRVYSDKGSMLKEKVLFRNRNKYEERWVLKGISFDIEKGEAVGLIGHNGCGKSTTLKLLTRILYPDEGSISLKGRVSSLLELGAGFHPDMSGRENIYINAAIFGLSRKEIDDRLDDIIEFSELEKYIDNPVRTYSSGMYMRLAFSVAINVDADILLIDEILAVGDVNFQTKCFNKLVEIKKGGTTIVLVSHSTDQIERICERSIWINDGLIVMDGNPREVHNNYLCYMGKERQKNVEEHKDVEKDKVLENQDGKNDSDKVSRQKSREKSVSPILRRGSGKARIVNVTICDKNGKPRNVFMMGEDIVFKLKYEVYSEVVQATFGLCMIRNDGVYCCGINSRLDGMKLPTLRGNGEVVLVYPKIALFQGKFDVDTCIEEKQGEMVDYYNNCLSFEIAPTNSGLGVVKLNHIWELPTEGDDLKK